MEILNFGDFSRAGDCDNTTLIFWFFMILETKIAVELAKFRNLPHSYPYPL